MFEAFSVRLTDDKSYPKYIQLRDQLAEFIKANDIASGEQLPDIVSMCRIAGLSNRSVERAYMMLINDGICFRRPKRGRSCAGRCRRTTAACGRASARSSPGTTRCALKRTT